MVKQLLIVGHMRKHQLNTLPDGKVNHLSSDLVAANVILENDFLAEMN